MGVVNMKRAAVYSVGAALALSVGTGWAEPSSNVAWTSETRAKLMAADAGAGKAMYVQEDCAKCHGDNGIAERDLYPNLGGLPLAYVYKQLRDYKDETRDNRRMQRVVEDLEEQDLLNLAAYVASFPPSPAREPDLMGRREVDLEAPRKLVEQGDGSRLIPACNVCHGAAARRTPASLPVGAPPLGGQQMEYFIETMYAYKNDDRTNDVYSVMRWIAKALDDREIEQLAIYYVSQGAPPPQAKAD